MKYCYHCGRLTSGEPVFCNFCGRSYDVKLCPRLHPNPRVATVCSRCGSRELSTPQPKVSFWWKILILVLQLLGGIALVYLSLSVVVELLKSPMVQAGLIGLVFLVAALWALWMLLPEWLRKLITSRIARKERNDER